MKTDLSRFDNSWYAPGKGRIILLLWYLSNIIFIKNHFLPISFVKISVLRLFGARIGNGVIIKPGVNIKYPWRLVVGDNCWIGEDVWIDNLADVCIGSNVCISQGAMLLCGNHNYKKSTFDLQIGEIVIEDGVWLGAKSIVCGSVIAKSHAILSVGSVASTYLDSNSIYRGNPAVKVRERVIEG